jgi:hypothetical protein
VKRAPDAVCLADFLDALLDDFAESFARSVLSDAFFLFGVVLRHGVHAGRFVAAEATLPRLRCRGHRGAVDCLD